MSQDKWEKTSVKSKKHDQPCTDPIIKPRECVVRDSYDAVKVLEEWVREQGITILEAEIVATSQILAKKTKETPNGHSTVFKVEEETGFVVYCSRGKKKVEENSDPLPSQGQDNWENSMVKSKKYDQPCTDCIIEPRECEVEPNDAKTLANWVQEQGITITRENAVEIGQKLAKKTIKGHVTVFKVDEKTGYVMYRYQGNQQ